MRSDHFPASQAKNGHLLEKYEKRLVSHLTPLVPSSIETYHLTNSSYLWAVIAVLSGYLARTQLIWIWGIGLAIILQYLTDILDGAVGRHRNTGLVRWGFFMDHFADYIFTASIFLAWGFLLPSQYQLLLPVIITLAGGFMVSFHLFFATTRIFQTRWGSIGTTEFRLAGVLINAGVYFIGLNIVPFLFIASIIIGSLLLARIIYKMQYKLWFMDMKAKPTKPFNDTKIGSDKPGKKKSPAHPA